VTDWRDHPPATRAALAAVSNGRCYFPGCAVPIVVLVEGQPEVNVEVVRIRGDRPDGPRYVADMSDEDRSSFDNVLLFCVPHRKAVDRDEEAHPVDLLETWKAYAAAGSRDALRSLGDVTEHRLDQLLTTAYAATGKQLAEAFSRFETFDAEAAQVIRHLVHTDRDQSAGASIDRESGTQLLNRLEELVTRLEAATKRLNVGWKK
jgi:hypothetical protein